MSEMVDRVARVIMDLDGCGLTREGSRVFCNDPALPAKHRCTFCSCKDAARAAIGAMRMPDHGQNLTFTNIIGLQRYVDVQRQFNAIIDAALSQ